MVQGFDSKLISSFYLWLDYIICAKGRAFTNISSLFYKTQESQFPLYSFSSPYKSFIYDSSVPQAVIPSGISGSNGFIARGTSGLKIDYKDGRILINNGIIDNFSGSYSVKDFNIYLENDDQNGIIFEDRYKYNPSFGSAYSGNTPREIYLPGIFINIPESKNTPFAFGGEDDHKTTIRLTVIGDKYNKNLNLISLLKDQCNTYFPILATELVPLNIYGDLKSGFYSYEQIRNDAQNNNNQLVRIEYVKSSTLNDKTIRARGELVNFIDFDLSVLRFPRLYYG